MPRPLLLLGGASPAPGRDSLDQADARGLPVWLADTPEHLAAAPQLTARAARVVPLDHTDVDACLDWAAREGAAAGLLGVYGFREQTVEAVAAVAEALGLPGNGRDVARLIRDKHACRSALRARGFDQPDSRVCSTRAEAAAFLASTTGPWVVKPPMGQGSSGVSTVTSTDGLDAALGHLAAAGAGPAHGGQLLVETFQQGSEYSVEGVCVAGAGHVLAVTAKTTTGAPHFVELAHHMPAELPPYVHERVVRTVREALDALGVRWGVFHVECWIDGDRVVLGEVHNRPGGDHIHTMTQQLTGVPLHGTVFDQLLGRPVDLTGAAARGGAAIRFLTPAPGRVTAVTGWDAVRADPRVLVCDLPLEPGSVVRPLTSSDDRAGFVAATGPTAAAADEAAAALCASIAVTTEGAAAAPHDPPATAPATTRTATPVRTATEEPAAMPTAPRLADVRAALPVVAAGGYFNSGYTGPLCRAAHEAVITTSGREFSTGRMGAAARAIREDVHGRARMLVARLLGASGPHEIALTHHTTDGMNIVAHGLDWRPGDNAVTTRVEHKGGLLPLGVLRDRRGVDLRTVGWAPGEPHRDLPRRLCEAIDARTRLVVLSHVSYVDGGVLDLAPVIETAHRHGAFVAVDGAQSAGVLPIDVRVLDADAYAVSGQKWLCGPEGTGALYLHPRGLDRIAQTYVGWASVDTWELDGHFTPNADVTRFEVGTRGLPQIAGFGAALGWHLDEVGTAWAAKRTADLAEEARQTLIGRPGLTVLTPDDHTGLLSVRTEAPAEEVVRRMAERGFTVRTIQGYDCVRACVGFFHTADEVAEMTRNLIDAARP